MWHKNVAQGIQVLLLKVLRHEEKNPCMSENCPPHFTPLCSQLFLLQRIDSIYFLLVEEGAPDEKKHLSCTKAAKTKLRT